MAKNTRNRRRKIAPRTSPTLPQSQEDCALLNLPPEIRNLISEFVVVKPSRIELLVHFTKKKRKNLNYSHAVMSPVVAQPAYTRTCKQVRHEALPIFYLVNTFEYHFAPVQSSVFLTEFTALSKWCATLEGKNQQALSEVLCSTCEPLNWVQEHMSLSAFASREMVEGWIVEADMTGWGACVSGVKYCERLKRYAINVPVMSAWRTSQLERM